MEDKHHQRELGRGFLRSLPHALAGALAVTVARAFGWTENMVSYTVKYSMFTQETYPALLFLTESFFFITTAAGSQGYFARIEESTKCQRRKKIYNLALIMIYSMLLLAAVVFQRSRGI